MSLAKISTKFPITVIPTQMRYNLTKGMYEGEEGEKLCEISYEILSDKWIKQESIENPQNGQVTVETVEVPFETPVLFHTGKKVIPYGLYLLIESYRNEPVPEVLQQINGALSSFEFQYSLEGFVLQVSDID